MDLPEVMDFLKSHSREGDPHGVCIKTVNLATTNRSHWLEVTRQLEPMKETLLSAAAQGRWLFVTPRRNVEEFRLRFPDFYRRPGTTRVVVDRETYDIDMKPGETVVFSRRAGKFRPGPARRAGLAKTSELYGPIKQAYFSPFIMVYGTRAHDERGHMFADMTLHGARTQAFRWWRRGNGYVDVIPDTCVTDSIIADFNLILFGTSDCNRFLERIERHLPIKARWGKPLREFSIAGEKVRGAAGAMFIYPNPLNPDRFVVVVEPGWRTGLFNPFYAGAGLPDYIIYSGSEETMGWAGVLCTGFFDADWQVDKKLMFLAE